MTRWLRVLSMLSGFALLPAIGHAATIAPADTTGLRSFNGGVNVLLLGFTAVKDVLPSGQEDRTVAHFDLGVLSGTIPTTTLEIPVYGIDPGDPTGIFEVYAFAGDGVGLPDASLVIAPEPATASLLGGAMMALALLRARRVF